MILNLFIPQVYANGLGYDFVVVSDEQSLIARGRPKNVALFRKNPTV